MKTGRLVDTLNELVRKDMMIMEILENINRVQRKVKLTKPI